MTKLSEIEEAVGTLTREQLAEFRNWFEAYLADQWDLQIEADAAAGRLDALAKEAVAEYEQGRCREL